MDDDDRAGRLSVAVEGDRIAAVAGPREIRRRFPDAERVDCSGRVLLPGLVNAHLHPELQVLKGALEELDLHDWDDAEHLDAALAHLSSANGRWIQRASIRAALADCLLGGTTRVATYGVTRGADEVAAEELVALGLRGAVTVRDVDFEPVTPGANGSVRRFYRLHAEEALTEAELEAAARAHARGERIIMHAAETQHRLEVVRKHFGTTTVRLLDRYDLLSPRTLLSHALYVDDEERRTLAERGGAIVASPSAELKLSDGIAPITDYLRLGVTVALGTDTAVCNNGNDMFFEMRQLGLTQKLRYGADAVPAERILRVATRDGAVVLGGVPGGGTGAGVEGEAEADPKRAAGAAAENAGEAAANRVARAARDVAPGAAPDDGAEGGADALPFGQLREGWAADLILVDAGTPRMQPLVHHNGFSNAAANLVYAATGQDVTDVMVEGEWRVRERRIVGVDAGELWTELGRAAEELYRGIL